MLIRSSNCCTYIALLSLAAPFAAFIVDCNSHNPHIAGHMLSYMCVIKMAI